MLTHIATPQEIKKKGRFIHCTENLLNCSFVLPIQQEKVEKRKNVQSLLTVDCLKVKLNLLTSSQQIS
jgi:hypothetical protein